MSPISAPSFTELPAGPGYRLRVGGEIVGDPGPTPPVWTWEISDAAGTKVPSTPVPGTPRQVDFPLARPGSYVIRARVSTETICFGEALAIAVAYPTRIAYLRFRITAPPAVRAPAQEVLVRVAAGGGGAPAPPQTVVVRSGQPVSIDPQDATGTRAVASYVRIRSAGSSLSLEGHTAAGPFRTVLSPLPYDVLIVPDGPAAPVLYGQLTPPDIASQTFRLGEGVRVSGRLLDSAGAPVKDAQVVLRADALPSTVARSDAQGAFSLRAGGDPLRRRTETFAALVAAPPESGLPDAEIPRSPGITVDPALQAGQPLDLEFRWKAIPTAQLGLTVRSAAGSALAGARVRIASEVDITNAGVLLIRDAGGAGPTLAATGVVRIDRTTDDTGSVAVARLPRGRYVATIVPAQGGGGAAADAAITSTLLDLSAGDLPAQEVRLRRKVKLAGRLLADRDTAGLRLLAIDTGADALGRTLTTTTGDGGSYTIEVDPQRSYVLLAEPPPDRPLARVVLGPVAVASQDTAGSDHRLPRTQIFEGRLLLEQTALGGAVIQAFCVAPSGCVDPTLPLAETVSRADGAFQLLLAEPEL